MTSFLLLLGTTRMYLFSDFVLVYDLTVGRILNPRPLAHPSRWFIWLVIVLAISAVLSPVTLAQSWQTVFRLVVLAYLLPNYKIIFGRISKAFLVIIVCVAFWQILTFENRAHGHHINASVFGMFGMALVLYAGWPIALLGSGVLATSIARIPLGILWVYALIDWRLKTFVIVIVATALFGVIGMWQTPHRLNISGIGKSVELRVEAVTGYDDETLDTVYGDGRCGIRRPVELKWFGYGFGGYCHNTGTPTPHNAYKLSVYELGVLAVPFWICLVMLVRRMPWRVWLPLAVMAFGTDDLFGTPEGLYIVAIWLVSVGVFHTASTHDAWYGKSQE